MGENGGGNTIVPLVSVKGEGLTGSSIITYDRADLDLLCSMFGKRIYIPNDVKTAYDVLPWIMQRFGIMLYTDDIVDTPVTWVGDSATVTLTAKSESLVYIGSCQLETLAMAPEIGNVIKVPYVNNYTADIHANAAARTAVTLTYGIDASEAYDSLITLNSDTYTGQLLYDYVIGNTVITPPALNSTYFNIAEAPDDSKVNLFNSTLRYNGLNSGIDHTRKSFKYVLIIDLPEVTDGYIGSLYFHYNNPADLGELK